MFRPLDYPEVKKLSGELFTSLFDESGRGAILIATAHADDHLTNLIRTIFPKELSKKHQDAILKYPGVLSSFSAKIELAYVFRLIDLGLYRSLNALRKIRNDAAHSSSKFELHELNEKLKSVFDLGPGFMNFIKDVSSRTLIEHKMESIKSLLDESELSEPDRRELFNKLFHEKTNVSTLEKQVPFWELTFGLLFLCGLISYHKETISKFAENNSVLSEYFRVNLDSLKKNDR